MKTNSFNSVDFSQGEFGNDNVFMNVCTKKKESRHPHRTQFAHNLQKRLVAQANDSLAGCGKKPSS